MTGAETFQSFHPTPAAPTTALAGAGAGNVDNGTHVVVQTCITAGGETLPSVISNATNVVNNAVNGQITVTLVAGNQFATGRNLYASKAGTTTPLFLIAASPLIADGSTTTTYTYNTADASLLATNPPTSNTATETTMTLSASTGSIIATGPFTPAAGGIAPITYYPATARASYQTADGATLSAERVTNGTFASGASWTPGAGWAIAGGFLTGTLASSSTFQSNVAATTGKYHLISFTVSGWSAGTVTVLVLGSSYDTLVAAGNGTYTYIHAPTNTDRFLYVAGTGFSGNVTNVSAKEITPIYTQSPYTAIAGGRVIANGDSIANLGGYQSRLSYNNPLYQVTTRAYSGQGLTTIYSHYQADVLLDPPNIVILEGGINDAISSQLATTMESTMTQFIQMALNNRITPIVLNISPWGGLASWSSAKQTITDTYNAWLLSYCQQNNILMVDAFHLLQDPLNPNNLNPNYDSGDHEHPNVSGQNVLGDAIYYTLASRPPAITNPGLQGGSFKDLTESSATAFVAITVPTSQAVAGIIHYTILAADATNTQALSGQLYFSAVASAAGAVTAATLSDVHTLNPVSAGTLTNTMTEGTATNTLTISSNAVSSLTQTTLRIKYRVDLQGATGIVAAQ